MDWSVRYVYVELNFILFLVHSHSRAPARIKIREHVRQVAGKISENEKEFGKSLLWQNHKDFEEKIAHHTCPVGY